MKALEGYIPNGWYWILAEGPLVCGAFLMDDFGNAIPYNKSLLLARYISFTN